MVSFGALADSCSSNAIERINQELKRRTRVARVFPDEHSLLRLITALLCETSEEWGNPKNLPQHANPTPALRLIPAHFTEKHLRGH